ncbi:MAG: hypothetical protein AB8G05_00665 [Oligoflexales bacterium]
MLKIILLLLPLNIFLTPLLLAFNDSDEILCQGSFKSPMCVNIGENQDHWTLWSEAYYRRQVSKIKDFTDVNFLLNHVNNFDDSEDEKRRKNSQEKQALLNQIILIPEASKDVDDKNFSLFWKLGEQETKDVAFENCEPACLRGMSDALKPRLMLLLIKKEQALNTKESLTRHAYWLLFTMRHYNAGAWSTALDAAISATAGPSARISAKSSALYAAISAAFDGTWRAARSAAWSDAWRSASNVARLSHISTALYAARSAACKSANEGKSPQKVGRIAYRVAENVSLLFYLLKNFDKMVENSYKASIENMTENPIENIFESTKRWNNFKLRYFDEIRDDAKHFLEPWLTELDRIAAKIEEAPE